MIPFCRVPLRRQPVVSGNLHGLFPGWIAGQYRTVPSTPPSQHHEWLVVKARGRGRTGENRRRSSSSHCPSRHFSCRRTISSPDGSTPGPSGSEHTLVNVDSLSCPATRRSEPQGSRFEPAFRPFMAVPIPPQILRALGPMVLPFLGGRPGSGVQPCAACVRPVRPGSPRATAKWPGRCRSRRAGHGVAGEVRVRIPGGSAPIGHPFLLGHGAVSPVAGASKWARGAEDSSPGISACPVIWLRGPQGRANSDND